MIDSGDAKKVLYLIQRNYAKTLKRLKLELEVVDNNRDHIVVKNYPPFFIRYMEDQGYCNREEFNTYKPCDVLAFVTMVHHGLFQSFTDMDIKEFFYERFNVKNTIGDHCVAECHGEQMQHAISEAIKCQMPIVLDFMNVKVVTAVFANAAIGKLYGMYAPKDVDFYIRYTNIKDEHAQLLRLVRENASRYYSDEEYRNVLNIIVQQQAENHEE